MIKISNNNNFSKKKKCTYCNNYAGIKRFYSGELLCESCFNKSIEKIIYKTISKFKMIKPKDKIIVALSGGKDSISLLYNLLKIQKKKYLSEPLIALSIDEGITQYRKKTIEIASKFCQKYKIEHKTVSFKEEIGKSLDEIVDIKTKSENYQYACNYCATIRRRLLNDYAIKLGGDVLAMGHNLTDISETFLMNILFKRYHLIANQYLFKKKTKELNKFYIQKINPLMRISEEEILKYADLKKLEFYESHCPYRDRDPILRKKVLNFLQELKKGSPEIEFNLLNGFLELSELLYSQNQEIEPNYCRICDYPCTNSNICLYCKLKKELKP